MKKWLLILLVLLAPTVALAEELYPAKADNGLWGYINAEAEWVIAPQFDGASGFRGEYAAAWMIPEGIDPEEWSGYDWLDYDCMGVIDRNGNWVLAPEYSLSSGQSGDWFGGKDEGIWLVNQWESSDLMGFFDIPSGTFSGLKWHEVWHWCSDSRLIPVVESGTYLAGYADRSTGEVVIPCQYYSVDPANFNDGVATVAQSDEDGMEITPWHLINEQGETIPLPEGYQSDYANDFSCGRIAVVSPEGLWGFADREGKIVIPAQFGYAYQFCEGFAEVTFLEGDSGYIDVEGNVLARGFANTFSFLNGYAEVWLSGHNAYDKVTAWINTKGVIVPFMDNDRFWPISPDRLWMRTEESYSAPYHLLDGEGNVLTAEPVRLMEMESWSFDEGLQAVRNGDGKWGYIERNGQVMIPFIYNAAYAFEGKLAEVRLGDQVGYIDQAGNAVYMWDDPIK